MEIACSAQCIYLQLVGDKSPVHELRVMAVVELHLNATYAFYEKRKYIMGGKLFSSYRSVSTSTKSLRFQNK